jgi:zinc transport system permease protein
MVIKMNDFITTLFNPNIPFIRYALIAGIMSSITFGIIGSFVVVKRMSYIAGAVSHAVLGGIGMALFLSTVFNLKFATPMLGAFIFAILAGLIISYATIKAKERTDTIIGAVWAIGMSIGLLFFSVTPGYVDPMSYLFGNILLITKNDLIMIFAINLIIIVLSLLFYNQLLIISFDQDFAETRGLNTKIFQILLIIMISLTVLLMITIVGIVMVIALLTLPAAISDLFSKKLSQMIFLSIILCAIFTVFGLTGSYMLNLPTSSITVLFAGFTYLIALAVSKVIK